MKTVGIKFIYDGISFVYMERFLITTIFMWFGLVLMKMCESGKNDKNVTLCVTTCDPHYVYDIVIESGDLAECDPRGAHCLYFPRRCFY